MRLLLDEHFAHEIAGQLRKLGHDVIAVTEDHELIHLADDELLRWAANNGRALVTENVRHCAPLHGSMLLSGAQHCGLIFTSARRYPRHRDGIGRLVSALDHLLCEARNPSPTGGVTWL